MKDNTQIVKVLEDEKSILRQLIELYEYDFSEFNGADVNAQGFYGYSYLDHYWTEEKRQAYFVKVDGQYAGFVLVNDFCYLVHDHARSIAEFFIMRKYRRNGIGQQVARLVFDTHKGNWEVLQHGSNDAAQHFWKRVIQEYTNGDYRVEDVRTEYWEGKGIVFNTSAEQRKGDD